MATPLRETGVPARWRLDLLGTWQLRHLSDSGGDDVSRVAVGLNGQRLFAVLALYGRCERTYLAGLLWPDCSEPHAQGNLRATLSRLRKRRLCGPLETTQGSVGLRPDVDVDVRHLVATATAVLDRDVRRPDRRTVRALGGSDLLLGWYDDWVLLERERLRQLRLHTLESLSARLVALGDLAGAVDAALAAVAIEPLRESAHRAVIQAHLAEGNRVEALRQYASLRRLLLDEVGVEPSRLAADLLR